MTIFVQTQGIQRRTMVAELRTTGDEFALVGYAATYNSWSKNLGGFREKIAPGAFTRSINSGADVKALFNHDPNHILGRMTSGTLKLEDTDKGLRFRCQLDRNSQYHRDLYASVKRGDISECSFAFTVPEGGDSWTQGMDPDTNQRIQVRTLTDVDLMDVSVVTYPAYNETEASARSQKPSAAEVSEALLTLRRLAQISAKELRAIAQTRSGRAMDQTDFASLGEHMRIAHELSEAACACSGTVRDILDAEDDYDPDSGYQNDSRSAGNPNPDEGYRKFRAAHARCHEALEQACVRCADTRLAHSKATKKGK